MKNIKHLDLEESPYFDAGFILLVSFIAFHLPNYFGIWIMATINIYSAVSAIACAKGVK